MSDKELEMREDLTDEQLDEFKASYGDPSEVPEPTAKKAKAPGKSKNVTMIHKTHQLLLNLKQTLLKSLLKWV